MKIKRFFKVIVVLLIISIFSPVTLPFGYVTTVEAATVKISQSELTLKVGEAATLKITGTKQKVTWSSSNKAIAKVSKTGDVFGVRVGKATITAKVNNKKYNCTVTVVKAEKVNPYLLNAPFSAQEAELGDFRFVIPEDWNKEDNEDQTYSYLYDKANKDLEDFSSVEIVLGETGIDTSDYTVMKEILAEENTQENVTAEFTKELIDAGVIAEDTPITYSDFKTSDFETALGMAFKVEFNISVDGIQRSEAIYYLFLNNYYIVLYTDTIKDNGKVDAKTAGEYILSSLQLK